MIGKIILTAALLCMLAVTMAFIWGYLVPFKALKPGDLAYTWLQDQKTDSISIGKWCSVFCNSKNLDFESASWRLNFEDKTQGVCNCKVRVK